MAQPAQPFARNGTEKMVYDVRMSPQAVWHDDTIFIVGWRGPLGLEQAQRPFGSVGSSGRAYLWIDGEWR